MPLRISSSVWESIHTRLRFLSGLTPAILSVSLYIYSPSRPESVQMYMHPTSSRLRSCLTVSNCPFTLSMISYLKTFGINGSVSVDHLFSRSSYLSG